MNIGVLSPRASYFLSGSISSTIDSSLQRVTCANISCFLQPWCKATCSILLFLSYYSEEKNRMDSISCEEVVLISYERDASVDIDVDFCPLFVGKIYFFLRKEKSPLMNEAQQSISWRQVSILTNRRQTCPSCGESFCPRLERASAGNFLVSFSKESSNYCVHWCILGDQRHIYSLNRKRQS